MSRQDPPGTPGRPALRPSEPALRERLAAEGLRAHAWGNAPGDRYGEHRHGYDKVLVAARGSITFILPERREEARLETGDRLDLPAGTLHGALVGPEGVTCLEAHLELGTLAGGPTLRRGWWTEGGEVARDGGGGAVDG